MKCSQCNRAAVLTLNDGQPLSVEHYSMLSAAIAEQQRQHMAMMNYYHDRMDDIFGLPRSSARINIPRPVIATSPVTYNNINVDRSVVGAINTAQVKQIDVALDSIKNGDTSEIGKALRALTEAVIVSSEIAQAKKDEFIEQLAFLAEQATLPKQAQQRTIIKSILASIPILIGTAASLASLWAQYGAQLEIFFKR